jgi:prolycopene isomerase
MSKHNFDVIVIGAGPGGSACAALLAKKGFDVLLIEQNAKAGGKAMTAKKQGFTYDLWPIAGAPVWGSGFEHLSRTLGLDFELAFRTGAALGTYYYRDLNGNCRTTVIPFSNVPPDPGKLGEKLQETFMEMIRWLQITDDEAARIIQFAAAKVALTEQEIDRLEDVSYHDYMCQFGVPRSFYAFSAAFANVAFVAPIDQVAASEVIRMERDYSEKGIGYYSKGGYGRIFERCIESLRDTGGTAKFKTRVERILVDDKQVKGVVTDKETFHSPIVISNAGIQPTVLNLVGREYFDSKYVQRVKDLMPSLGLMGTRYFLNKPLIAEAVSIVFSDNSYWNSERSERAKAGEVPHEMLLFNVIPSNFDAVLSPEGKQCVLSSTLCPPDPNFENNAAYWNKLDETMERVWPGFHDHVESKERYSTRDVSKLTREQVLPGIGGECIGLGQIVGQCGKHKPSAAAPISGLFYVGCDAGGRGVGTHQAVDSAFNVADRVEAHLRAFR